VNAVNLPFDAEAMLAGLKAWIECESPTFDASAVNRMMRLAAGDLESLGAKIETIPGRMNLADCVRASLPIQERASRASSFSAIWTPCIPSARLQSCRGDAAAVAATGRAFLT